MDLYKGLQEKALGLRSGLSEVIAILQLKSDGYKAANGNLERFAAHYREQYKHEDDEPSQGSYDRSVCNARAAISTSNMDKEISTAKIHLRDLDNFRVDLEQAAKGLGSKNKFEVEGAEVLIRNFSTTAVLSEAASTLAKCTKMLGSS